MKYSCLFDGGLGDVFLRSFEGNGYSSFNNLQPGDTCDIHIVSTNSYAHELWEWHPKRKQLNLIIHPWRNVKQNSDIRRTNNIPEDLYPPPSSEKPVIYPSPLDKEILNWVHTLRPFVIISAVAGTKERNISSENLGKIVPYVQEKGFRVVFIGRSFVRGGHYPVSPEIFCGYGSKVISMIDKLTVPGTLCLIERASALIVCHSSMALGNWLLYRRPNLIIYPSHLIAEFEDKNAMNPKTVSLTTEESFTFGRKFPETEVSFNERIDISLLDKILC